MAEDQDEEEEQPRGDEPDPEPADEPTTADVNLWAKAIRQDWPLPPLVKKALLQSAINIADPYDATSYGPRTKLAALKVVALFAKLTLDQQRVDLLLQRYRDGLPDEQAADGDGIDPALAARALRVIADDGQQRNPDGDDAD